MKAWDVYLYRQDCIELANLCEHSSVLEGATFTNITGHRQNADLSSDYTINKRGGFEFLSGAVSGSYKITG